MGNDSAQREALLHAGDRPISPVVRRNGSVRNPDLHLCPVGRRDRLVRQDISIFHCALNRPHVASISPAPERWQDHSAPPDALTPRREDAKVFFWLRFAWLGLLRPFVFFADLRLGVKPPAGDGRAVVPITPRWCAMRTLRTPAFRLLRVLASWREPLLCPISSSRLRVKDPAAASLGEGVVCFDGGEFAGGVSAAVSEPRP